MLLVVSYHLNNCSFDINIIHCAQSIVNIFFVFILDLIKYNKKARLSHRAYRVFIS